MPPIPKSSTGRCIPTLQPCDAAATSGQFLREIMRRRHHSLSEFRRGAATNPSVEGVIGEALYRAASVLHPDRCAYAIRLEQGDGLLLHAGTGWEPGVVGRERLSAAPDSLGGYTLLLEKPVVVEDLRLFPQPGGDPVLSGRGMTSALTAPVRGQRRPLGLLAVFSSKQRLFSPDDAEFLHGLANVVAAATYRAEWKRQMAYSPAHHRAPPPD